jgi:adenylate cyclase
MNYKAFLVAAIVGVLLAGLAGIHAFDTWNIRLTDNLYGGIQPLDKIVIVTIDDRSLQDIGKWPWARSAYLPLLENTAGSKIIAFDLTFSEPDGNDATLAAAMKGREVILAQEYHTAQDLMLSPAPAYSDVTRAVVNVFTDSDGIIRNVPAKVNGSPSMSFALATQYLGRPPSFDSDRLTVNYVGPPSSFRHYSASDVMNGKISADVFKDAIVLVGVSAPDLHDDYVVPTSQGTRMPGVEIHANALQTLLTKRFITPQPYLSLVIVIMIFAAIAGFMANIPMRYTIPISIGLFVAYIITAIFLFGRGIILNLVYPLMTIILASLATYGYIAATESQHKKYILQVFGRYVSKDVVTHLLSSKEAMELGGIEREVSAMFADIRGFTAMSEKMTPNEVIKVLNHYFGDMTDLVFKNKGTLDKFIGDALFAMWGSPLADEDHALRAVTCALQIQESIRARDVEGIPKIKLGIGICSGPAVVGNMGSSQRQEFTAIGDTINTASRLSGYAEGGEVKITESTYLLIKDKVNVKKLAPLQVKGKEKPLVVYEVLSLKA